MSILKTSDDVTISYERQGKGKPIVFIHGWSQTKEVFLPQVEELSKNFQVVTYDLRGHGQSERTEKGLSLERLAQDLEELMDYLTLKEVLLVGWSMGASIIFNYVKVFGTKNLKGVILFDMTPKLLNDKDWKLGLWHGKYDIKDALEDMTTMAHDFSQFAKVFFKKVAPYMNDEMIHLGMIETMKNTPHIMNAFWLSMVANDYRDVLETIDVPAQIAYGEDSTLYSEKTALYLKEKIPDARIDKFSNSTHLLVVENPSKVTELVSNFASEIF